MSRRNVMRHMVVAVLAARIVCAAEAQAQPTSSSPPEALAAARALLMASGAAQQFDAVLPAMTAQMANIFVQQQPAHERTIRESFANMGKRMSERKGEIIEEIAAVYARKLSAAEMNELAKFYSSGVGKKFIEMQPEITQDSMQAGQRWGARIGQEIEAEMLKELRAKGVPI